MMENKLRMMIDKARIVGLPYDQTLPEDIRAIYKEADNQSRFLSALEMKQICTFSGLDPGPILLLQKQAAVIVAEARNRLLAEEPELVQPGGALYPEARAEACWRDCWHFLRIALYALAADRTVFTHLPGVNGMSELYRELKVPIASMARALSHLRNESVACYTSMGGGRDARRLDKAFLHLEEMIKQLSFSRNSATTHPAW